MKMKVISAVFMVLAMLTACGSPSSTTSSSTMTTTNQVPPLTNVKLSTDVQPIFNANCVVCHQGASAPAGMSLESGQAYGNTVNKKSAESPLMRVLPGDPANSYLIAKLEGRQGQVGGSGAQMPFNSPPLPTATIDLIKRWITQGAPNN